MGKYFALEYDVPFKLFSAAHISVLVILFSVIVGMYIFREKLREEKANRYFRYTVAALLILAEGSLSVWRLSVGEWRIQTSLPLHMCGISIICSTIMMYTKSHRVFEMTYFWGLAGATAALLTPDLNVAFPHYRFIQFFGGHALILVACFFMTIVEGYRPTFRSIWKAFGVTNLYVLFVGGFNYLTGANYLFLAEKPAPGTMFDLFGPWPWYIVQLELVALIVFICLYLPFMYGEIAAWKNRSGQQKITL